MSPVLCFIKIQVILFLIYPVTANDVSRAFQCDLADFLSCKIAFLSKSSQSMSSK